MSEFIDRTRAMFAGVKVNPQIKVIKMEANIPDVDQATAQSIFEEIENRSGLKLADYFKEYMFLSDEIWLCWSYEIDGKEENGGEFRLINLFNVFALNERQLWTDDMDEAEKEFLRKLRPFDDHPYTGDGAMGVFKLEPGEEDPEVWYYKVADKSYKMDLTYKRYVECLLETRGYFDWQCLFCDIDIYQHHTDLPKRLAKMLDDLPKLFPDTDYAKYIERFEKLKKKRRRKK